jgi:hypothetical protein
MRKINQVPLYTRDAKQHTDDGNPAPLLDDSMCHVMLRGILIRVDDSPTELVMCGILDVGLDEFLDGVSNNRAITVNEKGI